MKNRKRPKPKKRIQLRKDITLIILITLTILVSASILSYDPKDLIAYKLGIRTTNYNNFCGIFGAYFSHFLITNIGLSTFVIIFWLLLSTFSVWRFDNLKMNFKKLAFYILMILSLSVLFSLLFPESIQFKGSKISLGGRIGKELTYYVSLFFGIKGTFLLASSLLLISFAFATDFDLSSFSRLKKVFLMYRELQRKIISGFKKKVKREQINKNKKQATLPIEKKIEEPASVVMEAVNRNDPTDDQFNHEEVQSSFTLPTLELLNDPVQRQDPDQVREVMEATAKKLEQKLLDFGVQGEVTGIQPGPVITLYEFRPAPGIKISKIANLADDLALGLKALSIRIIAPIPGKDAVGVEIPNPKKEIVFLKEILSSREFQDSTLRLPLSLGKDTVGRPVIADLSKMPHLLVAGATGTGKSVCINAMVISLLFKFTPDLIKFIMVDPKRIELSLYDDIPHLLHPVVSHPKEATSALKWAVKEMERRYELLLEMGAKNLAGYNAKVLKEAKAGIGGKEILPYIIIIIDELADLMMVSSKEVEDSIARLAQMARASGIHLILATQRPSVDVITGLIKANFPARISFQVSSKVDSRTVLDRIGAERLLGEGDMLFMPPGVGRLLRIHGAYVSEDEVQRVTDFLRSQGKPNYQISLAEPEEGSSSDDALEADEKYQEAVDLVIKTGQASISMIQRRLRVGYNRAARMIELMEKQGIVGPSDGIKPREVYGRK